MGAVSKVYIRLMTIVLLISFILVTYGEQVIFAVGFTDVKNLEFSLNSDTIVTEIPLKIDLIVEYQNGVKESISGINILSDNTDVLISETAGVIKGIKTGIAHLINASFYRHTKHQVKY